MNLHQARSEAERQAVELFRETNFAWTGAEVADLIARQEVPSTYLDTLVQRLAQYPAAMNITDQEFQRAITAVRPDLAPLLKSEAGQRWLQKASWELSLRLLLRCFA